MVGPGIDHITPDIQDKLAALLDMLPATATINVQTDAGYVDVSRDWPATAWKPSIASWTKSPTLRA
jgi:hypothetical protein